MVLDTYARNKVIFGWENITAPVILADELRPRRYALLRPLRWYSGVHTRFGRAGNQNEKAFTNSEAVVMEYLVLVVSVKIYTPESRSCSSLSES